MTYLLKFILCSGVLYTFYHLVLRNERLFRFNRFFLLSILLLAAIIPLITVKTSIIEIPAAQTMETLNVQSGRQPEISQHPISETADFDIEQLLVVAYIAVTAFFLIRFGLNLWSLNRFKKGGSIIHSNGIKIVLRSDIQHSFSFLNHIYTNKASFEKGETPREIIVHEEAHIRQRHSYDILFIECMSCLCWFNPIVYLIKRAIRLNHEFLADEVTISKTGALVEYQNIIIHFASQQLVHSPVLASHLTFGETKKRFKIMVRTQNKTITLAKKIMAIAVIFFLFVTFGETKIIAQEAPKRVITTAVPFLTISPKEPVEVQDTKKHSDALVPRPPILVTLRMKSRVSYRNSSGEIVKATFKDLPKQIQKDFVNGNLEGKIWVPPYPALVITQDMLNDFQDAKEYGVWIDKQRVSNAELKNYRPSDFYNFYKSKLNKRASHYGQYVYQVNMVTQNAHDKNPPKERWFKFRGEKMADEEVRKLIDSRD